MRDTVTLNRLISGQALRGGECGSSDAEYTSPVHEAGDPKMHPALGWLG